MLEHRHSRGSHHAVVGVALEDHAERRRLGHGLVQQGVESIVVDARRRIVQKRRPVVVEHAAQALEGALVGYERSILGEVAALGVPADDERAGERRRHARQVRRRRALGRDHFLEAEVEVFLPTGETAVGATIREVGDLAVGGGERQRDGGELLFHDLRSLVGIERGAHVAHAAACRQDVQKRLGVLRVLHPAVRGERFPIGQHHHVVQQDAVGGSEVDAGRHLVVEVRERREHKRVDGVKR